MTPSKDPENGPQPGHKRQNLDGQDDNPKSKRPRYVLNACNECKRRKVKCDGKEPCQRCVNGIILCSYHRPAHQTVSGTARPVQNLHNEGEGMNIRESELHQVTMQMRAVMERVDGLNEKLTALSSPSPARTTREPLTNNDGLHDPAHLRFFPVDAPQATSLQGRDQSMQPSVAIESEILSPEFHGPTSSEFTFEVANESLTELGVSRSICNKIQSTKALSLNSSPQNQRGDITILRRLLGRDPLWTMQRVDALKYIDNYHNTIGAMYPVTDETHMATKVNVVFDALEKVRNPQYRGNFGSLIDLMFDIDTQIVKTQLAIGLITTLGVTGTQAATDLVQTVLDSSDDSLMNAEGISGVQLLVAVSLFYFNLDQELKASRYSCLASRKCLEMGLHRRDILTKHFPASETRKQVLRVLWSAFTLDRRSSIGLGIPPVIQDSLIDSALLSIDFDHLYLRTMIPFAKLSGKAWQLSNDFSSKEHDTVREEIDYLDYQVLQWRKQIPACIRYCHGSTDIPFSTSSDGATLRSFYLSVALFARANQLRNLIYRPLLQSASRIKCDPERTLTAISIAKDSIYAFSDIDATTNLLGIHATFFKHFIVSSLGNLLLILVHSPPEYWTEIRDTFRVASTLLGKLSTRSGPILQAWDRLKGLEDLHAEILAARRRKTGPQQSGLNDDEGISGMKLGETALGLNISNELAGDSVGFGDYTLFDSQIRDEFFELLDPSLAFRDFYDFPFLEGGDRN